MNKKMKMGIRLKFTIFFLILGIVLTAGLSQMTYYVVRYQKIGQEDCSNENIVERSMHKAASFLIRNKTGSSTYSESLLDMLDSLADSIYQTDELIQDYEAVLQEAGISMSDAEEETALSSEEISAAAEGEADPNSTIAGEGENDPNSTIAEEGENDQNSVIEEDDQNPATEDSEVLSDHEEDGGTASTKIDDIDYQEKLKDIKDPAKKRLLKYLSRELPSLCNTYHLASVYMIYTYDLPKSESTALAENAMPVYWGSVSMNRNDNSPFYDAWPEEEVEDFYTDEFAGLRNVIWNTMYRTEELDITTNENQEKVATVYIPIFSDAASQEEGDEEEGDEEEEMVEESYRVYAVLGADIRMDALLEEVREQVLPMAGVIAISVLLLMVLLILFVNHVVLKPVRDLNRGVSEMREGKWNATATVHSTDELGDIAGTFNEMSRNISSHIKNMEALNEGYARFLPERAIRLQNADSIINIHEGDYRTISGMTILSMQIDDIDTRSSRMQPDELFRFLNRVTSISIPVVSATEDHEQGIIERMENGGMEVYYENSTEQALMDALNICRKFRETEDSGQLDLSIAITKGEILLGVVGQEERMDFVAFSEEKKLAAHLMEQADSYYANILISGDAADAITDFRTRYHARLVCYVDVPAGLSESGETIFRKEAVYDVFDSDPEEQRQLKQYTAETFEQGVLEYTAGEYEKASRHFLEVLRWNRNDRAARQYL